MVLLAFENVSKSYGSTPALEHINFEIEAGKIIGFARSKWLWKDNYN